MPQYGTVDRAFTEPARCDPNSNTSNFVEFPTLYGHFAGETVHEDDEILEPDGYFSSNALDEATTEAEDGHSGHSWGEDSALLTPGKREYRRKARTATKRSPIEATLLFLESFVGTGVLSLPRAFYSGGMLFSFLVLIILACFSYYCFILLVGTRLKSHASYGDMDGIIFGLTVQNTMSFSLVLSQVGFASAYIVFVPENNQALILWMILFQISIFLPISLYRNINNIHKMAFVADVSLQTLANRS